MNGPRKMKAERLYQAEKRARKVFRAYHYNHFSLITPEHERRLLGLYRKTRVPCSCWMCGHRRATSGPRIQELKQIDTDTG